MSTPVSALPNIEKDKLAAAVEAYRRNADLLIEHYMITARIRRKAFEAYLTQGFNEAQALELCAKP